MNQLYAIIFGTILFFVLSFSKSFGWGTDKVVNLSGSSAQHSMAAKQNGFLFAAAPFGLLTGQYSTTFYTSTDNGETWSALSISSPTSISPVVKTKMVTTSMDSVLCFILQDNSIYIINMESGVQGQFVLTGAQDFDVAVGSGNFCYVFVQEPALNTIRRYGTGDGGITWTGNTALVTTGGFGPKVHMSGTRLILNYYGPVLPDTTSSIIRAAIYNETAAGTITPGTFQDVATNNTIKKKQFQSVVNNGLVWFYFTEGDAMQVLKCRVSLDNGATYQPEIIVSGNIQVNAFWFNAAPYALSGTFGTSVTWLADSIAPTGSFDRMLYAAASNAAPSSFTIPASPFDTYNDTAVTSSSTSILPVMIHYSFGPNFETGIAWLGENISGPSLYFDRYSAITTGLNYFESISLNLYPSPAKDELNITGMENISLLEIFTNDGRMVFSKSLTKQSAGSNKITLDIGTLSSGIYTIRATNNSGTSLQKFSIVK